MQSGAGFDLGNSPQEFNPGAVQGKTILITTTNGTRALLGVQGARDIVIASYVNKTAVLAMMKVAASSGATDIAIICAGEEGTFTLGAPPARGVTFRAIPKRAESIVLNDAASASVLIERKYGDNIAKVFKESSHGQALESAGFGDALSAAAEVGRLFCGPDLPGPANHEARAGTGAIALPRAPCSRARSAGLFSFFSRSFSAGHSSPKATRRSLVVAAE